MSDSDRHHAEPALDVAVMLAAYFEDDLPPEDLDRLNGILAQDAFARELFIQFAMQRCLMVRSEMRQRIVATQPTAEEDLDSQKLLLEVLEQERLARSRRQQDQIALEEQEPPAWTQWHLVQHEQVVPVRHIVIPRPLFYAAVSSLAAVLALMVYLFFTQQPVTKPIAPPLAHSPVAVASIVDAIDAHWLDKSQSMQIGTRLNASQPLRLVEGLVRLRFDNDAELIVQGPADLTPIDSSSLRLQSGRLVGHCPTPRSHGFTIHTPTAQIIDVGTEFAVQVESDGSIETHVFDGRVDLLPLRQGEPSLEAIVLKTGDARRVDHTGRIEAPIHSDGRTFVREEEFDALGKAQQGSVYHRWLAHRYRLQRDEALLVFYDFSRRDDVVPDLSRSGYDAIVTGAITVPGRFPNTEAMAFIEPTHGLSINIPDALHQATFIAWVMLYPHEQTNEPHRGILLPDEALQYMSPHWQFDTLLRHSFGYYSPEKHVTLRAGSAVLGQWQCIAVVFDQSAGTYHIYVNGQELDRQVIATDEPLCIGRAGIGNWARETRPLLGAIDEMWIFERPMSPSELREIAQLRPDSLGSL